jgi:UDP-N-acetylglucosamine diphosphorylase/glucosamine-1-phosphate N-acetyltransferase
MHVCIFEDTAYTNFLPLVYFRPVYELRCGARSLREKIEAALPTRSKKVLHARPGVARCLAGELPQYSVNSLPDDDTWFINGRVLADDAFGKLVRKRPKEARVFCQGEDVAAAFVPRNQIVQLGSSITAGEPLNETTFRGVPTEPFAGRMVGYPWHLIHQTAEEIGADFEKIKRAETIAGNVYAGTHLLNKKNILVGKGSVVKPGVVLDAERGPIVIGKNVTIMPNAFVEGPVFIGDNSLIKVGAKIYHGTSIGQWCKVGGEVDASIIQSYSNKQHDGFLGHSYLGSWVNLGADTNTSDLKNTYGTIRIHVNGALLDSEMQFLGLIMGDHSKSGINVMFDTGTVVGVSCNIYGAGLPPKFVPSFAWGSEKKYSTYNLEKGLETAQRVMMRRDVVMSPAYEQLYRDVFAVTEHDRQTNGVIG